MEYYYDELFNLYFSVKESNILMESSGNKKNTSKIQLNMIIKWSVSVIIYIAILILYFKLMHSFPSYYNFIVLGFICVNAIYVFSVTKFLEKQNFTKGMDLYDINLRSKDTQDIIIAFKTNIQVRKILANIPPSKRITLFSMIGEIGEQKKSEIIRSCINIIQLLIIPSLFCFLGITFSNFPLLAIYFISCCVLFASVTSLLKLLDNYYYLSSNKREVLKKHIEFTNFIKMLIVYW